MFVKILLIVLLYPYLVCTEPLELTDKTWKNMLKGQWMVEFYAPWCSACQKFKPIWNDFSTAMSSKNVKVAAVNVDQYPALTGRFRIAALPTIYYVRDGIFRRFDGERSLNGLKNYIEHEDWQKTEPVSSYLAPNSILMSLTDSLFQAPVFVKNTFILLQEEYGLPAWLIYIIIGIAVIITGIGLALGVVFIFDSLTGAFSATTPQSVSSEEQPVTDLTEDQNNEKLKPINTDEEEQTIHQRRLEN